MFWLPWASQRLPILVSSRACPRDLSPAHPGPRTPPDVRDTLCTAEPSTLAARPPLLPAVRAPWCPLSHTPEALVAPLPSPSALPGCLAFSHTRGAPSSSPPPTPGWRPSTLQASGPPTNTTCCKAPSCGPAALGASSLLPSARSRAAVSLTDSCPDSRKQPLNVNRTKETGTSRWGCGDDEDTARSAGQ